MLVKTHGEEEVCNFSTTTNQQNKTASLHQRDHLLFKGPKSSSTFFSILFGNHKTPEMNLLKGHQERAPRCLLFTVASHSLQFVSSSDLEI